MKICRWTGALALVLALTLAAGCGKTPAPSSGGEPASTPAKVERVRITDEAVLDQVWKDYLDLSVFTIQRNFDSPSRLQIEYAIVYCWYSFQRSGGAQELALAGTEDDTQLILPAETMSRLMKRYFDLEVTSFAGARPQSYFWGISYREETGDFLVSLSDNPEIQEVNPSGDDNPWDMYFEEYWDNGDGTTTAVIAPRDSQDAAPTYTRTITFGKRENGELYWKSFHQEWPNYHKADLKGYYEEFVTPFVQEILFDEDATYLGQNETSVYFYTIGSASSGADETLCRRVTFYQLSKEDYVVNREMSVEVDWDDAYDGYHSVSVKAVEDGFLMTAPQKIYRVGYDLGAPQQVDLPPYMAERIVAADLTDINGMPYRGMKDRFSGYDVSADLTKFLYSDAEGIHLYQLEVPADELAKRIEDAWWAAKAQEEYTGEPVVEGKDTLLLESELMESGKFGTLGYYLRPQFFDGERRVFCEAGGYESLSATALLTLKEADAPDDWDSDFPWLEATDSRRVSAAEVTVDISPLEDGLLLHYWDESPVRLQVYSFAEGETREVALPQETSFFGYYREQAGLRAYLVCTDGYQNPQEPPDPRIDLMVQNAEEEVPRKIFSASMLSARVEFLDILEDGTYLCAYQVSPGERGILVVREKR